MCSCNTPSLFQCELFCAKHIQLPCVAPRRQHHLSASATSRVQQVTDSRLRDWTSSANGGPHGRYQCCGRTPAPCETSASCRGYRHLWHPSESRQRHALGAAAYACTDDGRAPSGCSESRSCRSQDDGECRHRAQPWTGARMAPRSKDTGPLDPCLAPRTECLTVAAAVSPFTSREGSSTVVGSIVVPSEGQYGRDRRADTGARSGRAARPSVSREHSLLPVGQRTPWRSPIDRSQPTPRRSRRRGLVPSVLVPREYAVILLGQRPPWRYTLDQYGVPIRHASGPTRKGADSQAGGGPPAEGVAVTADWVYHIGGGISLYENRPFCTALQEQKEGAR